MMNHQTKWNCNSQDFFIPYGNSGKERQPKRRKDKVFQIKPLSSEVFVNGLRAVWQTDKTPAKPKLSPETLKAIALLDSWDDGDAEEQKETWEYLKTALDENRLSDRKLFP